MYIKTKKDLKEFLEYERKLYGRKNANKPLIAIKETDILWKHNYFLRKAEYYINTKKKIRSSFYKIKLKLFQNKYCLIIPINVFDKGLKLVHLGPRLVNGNVKVGKNCTLHMNTCIVAGGTEKGGLPVLGDNIIMGVGSIIAGNVIIGDNIAIGANAFVNKNFKEGNITIAGVPAKKISNNTKLDWNKNGKNNEYNVN